MIPHPTTTQPLAEQIREAVKRGRLTLPPLPELAIQLLGMLRDQDHADLTRVGNVIEKDEAFAASVLRLANSALFGGMRQVESLSDASARIGLRQLSTMVTTVSHRGHFVTNDADRLATLHTLWDHALASAVGARQLAVRGGGDRAEAYLAGLLHDVGKLLVLKGVDEIASRPGVPRVDPLVTDALMTQLHCELGGRTLDDWRLPSSIVRVAQHHHDSGPAEEELLVVRVKVASALASKLGFSVHPQPFMQLMPLQCVERLGLGDLELAEMLVDIEDEVRQVKSML